MGLIVARAGADCKPPAEAAFTAIFTKARRSAKITNPCNDSYVFFVLSCLRDKQALRISCYADVKYAVGAP